MLKMTRSQWSRANNSGEDGFIWKIVESTGELKRVLESLKESGEMHMRAEGRNESI